MTLRQHWRETEEWVKMEGGLYFHGKPMRLPDLEFECFQNKFFKRLGTMLRLMNSPLANHPDARLLWWIWLNLDPGQQQLIIEVDVDDVVGRATRQMACHPELLIQMHDHRYVIEYWSTERYVQLVRGITPKCIVRLDRDRYIEIAREFNSSPKSARHRNLAICYNDNRDDVMTYLGEGYTLLADNDERLIVSTGKGNSQILKGQWIWFIGEGLKHGNHKTFQSFRLSIPNPADSPGFWIKPDVLKSDDMLLTENSMCPDINYV